jgi:uncharacterized protein YgiM (DUF1202 family)
VTAYANADGFGVGTPPYSLVFAADTNGDGLYGDVLDGIRQTKFKAAGKAVKVSGRINFAKPLAENTKVSVVAYQVDNDGVIRSGILGPVSFACSSRVEVEPFALTDASISKVDLATVVVIYVPNAQVYTEPNVSSRVIGGLGQTQRATALATNPKGDWLKITLGAKTGWVLWRTNGLVWGPRATLPVEVPTTPALVTPEATATK